MLNKPVAKSVVLLCCGWTAAFGSGSLAADAVGQLRQVGVARIDITPAYAIRLTGYAVRKTESEGVTQRLWAKALSIGSNVELDALVEQTKAVMAGVNATSLRKDATVVKAVTNGLSNVSAKLDVLIVEKPKRAFSFGDE